MSVDGSKIDERDYSLVVAPTGDSGTLGAINAASGFDVSNLRCVFKVKKNLKNEPNTGDVKVYNLAANSRAVLENATKLVIRLEAGYMGTGTSQLFFGEVRAATTTWEDTDSITQLTTGDSEKEMQEARIKMSVPPGTPPDVVLASVAKALKVNPGNLAQAVASLASKGVAEMFAKGTVINGKVARELTDMCRSVGLEWSVQDGKLQILDLNKTLADKAVLLSPDTGLVGNPTIDFVAASKKKAGGRYVKAKAFIIPELTPGRKVVMKSRSVQGGYRIEEVEYSGDTHGDEWFANLTLRSY